MGVPGCMDKKIHTTFWGRVRGEIATEDKEAREKMGLPKDNQDWVRKDCCNEEAEALYQEKQIQSEKLNAR